MRYSRPAQLQLEELAEAASQGVTLAMADRAAALAPLSPNFAMAISPSTTGIWQEPPNW